MNKAWIGIDTSNYTTSISTVVDDGRYYNIKTALCVKANEKGVRQSDAVFMHVKNLPDSFKRLITDIKSNYPNGVVFSAVGVSTRPRNIDGSYMPCFLSGVSVASSISSILNIPIYEFSHQEGHIRSALFGAGIDAPDEFYSFHLSGGTCELLEVKKTNFGFKESIIADSADITLGQLVDRTGVMLGINFPCGTDLEALALLSTKKYNIKIHGENRINLSGFENKVKQMIDNSESKFDIASYVYCVILAAIEKMLQAASNKHLPVLFAGGVSGSKVLQNHVQKICNAFFAPPSLSSDNAVGIALLTRDAYLK